MAHEWITDVLGFAPGYGPRQHLNGSNGSVTVTNPTRYGVTAYESELARLRLSIQGERNNQLNQSAFKLFGLCLNGFLDQATVAAGLTAVAREIGLPPTEIAKTIASALSAAQARSITVSASHVATTAELSLEDASGPASQPHGGSDQTNSQPAADSTPEFQPLDWHDLWANEDTEVEWLIEEIIERGRLHALYAPSKSGKSLFVQYLVAKAVRDNGLRAMYVDLENSHKDIRIRLSDMGFEPDDLQNLIYFSFPPLAPLDAPSGGAQLVSLAETYKVDLVVIDTTSRVIKGVENDADTFRALYRYAMMPLKAAGVAAIRIDHAGKDVRMGQRGSSAKGDDVDTVWYLEKGDTIGPSTRYTLKCDRQRTGNHPEMLTFYLRGEDGPLRFELGDSALSLSDDVDDDPIENIVRLLDALDIPLETSANKCEKWLKEKGLGQKRQHVQQAVKRRQSRSFGVVPMIGNHLAPVVDLKGGSQGGSQGGSNAGQ